MQEDEWGPITTPISGEVLPPMLSTSTHRELTQKDDKGLTPRMRRFVEAFIVNQGNATQAAITAGVSKAAASASGSRWLRSPAVIAELRSRMSDALVAHGPIIMNEQIRLALKSKSDFVRSQAGASLLDRMGAVVDGPPKGRVSIKIDLG